MCDTENGNASAKEARKRGVRGRFLAALEMTTGGSVDEQKSNNRRVSFNPPAPLSLKAGMSG